MMKHKAGVWYPVSDPPEENIYNIALCVSGKYEKNITFHRAIILDDENCYEDGQWYLKGHGIEDLKVNGWYMVPEYTGITEDEFWKTLGKRVMTEDAAKSCKHTIELLRRLAYNIHGVMDVIDEENCQKLFWLMDQIAKGEGEVDE